MGLHFEAAVADLMLSVESSNRCNVALKLLFLFVHTQWSHKSVYSCWSPTAPNIAPCQCDHALQQRVFKSSAW